MKVAVIRGNCLNKWDMQHFVNLKDFNFFPTGICSKDNQFNVNGIGIPVIKLKRFGTYNKIPIFSKINNYFLCYNHCLLGLEKVLKNFDIVHSAEISNAYTYQAVKTGKPVVVSCWENIPFNSNRWNYKRFKKEVKEKAKYFTAFTEKARGVLEIEGVNPDKMSVIPPGLDTSKFKPVKNKNKKVTILFVGRLVEGKGILVLLNALKNLDVKLLIVGDGPLKKEVISLSKKFNLDMQYVKSLDYFEMSKIYNSCDVFCLPSIPTKIWEEQFGMSLIEAMSCEKPVISTKSGSIPEVVNENVGILVEPNNVIELRNALIKLIEDKKLREKMGKEGRKYVIKNYKASLIAKKIKKIYEDYL